MQFISLYHIILFIILLFINKAFYQRAIINFKSTNYEELEKDNKDEDLYKTYHFGNFLKSLHRNDKGLVHAGVYEEYLNELNCIDNKFQGTFEATFFELSGPAFDSIRIPVPYKLESPKYLSELLELYGMALAADIPFKQFKYSDIIHYIAKSLNNSNHSDNSKKNKLFRGTSKGDQIGLYISQFLLKDINNGLHSYDQKIRTYESGIDFGTNISEYLDIQNSIINKKLKVSDERFYIRTGRDLAALVHHDHNYVFGFNAYNILTHSYSKARLHPIIRNDLIIHLMNKAQNIAVASAYYHKWYIHRYLRPEEGAFVLNQHLNSIINKELDLDNFILKSIFDVNGNYLLPLAYPEGSPLNPSYPSKTAAAISASITILKAFFDNDFVIEDAVTCTDTGLHLTDYNSKKIITVGNELDKLASNIAYGRLFARVNYRSDAESGLELGEKVAIKVLEEFKNMFEINNRSITFKFKKRYGCSMLI